MNVETYEVISVDEQHGNVINELVSEEALALIESLDLAGQRKLVEERQAGDESVIVRAPYRKMSAEEMAVFSAILPRQVPLAKYSDGPVPLRVLQIAAHAKDLYENLVVWCPANADDPDPLLVGVNGYSSWSKTARETFILARWGEILEPLDALRDKARGILRSAIGARIADAKAKLAAFEAAADAKLDLFLRTGEDASELFTLHLSR